MSRYSEINLTSKIKYIIAVFCLVKVAVHIATANGYGFFIDEIYTIALSKHPALGYVDLPPVVPAILAASRAACQTPSAGI